MNQKESSIDKYKRIIERLIDIDFSVPSELDGDSSCFYCGAYLSGGESHSNDCVYIEAKALIDTENKQ